MEKIKSFPKKAGEKGEGGKKLSRGKLAAIISGSAVMVIIIALVICAALVNNVKTVYPGVYFNGVSLSGMTRDEVASQLKNSGYGAGTIKAEVEFPDGSVISVEGKDIGITDDAEKMADLAVEYGKDRGFVGNFLTYAKGLFSKTSLQEAVYEGADMSAVQAKTKSAVDEFNKKMSGGGYEIKEDKLVIIKGAGSVQADTGEVEKLLDEAIYESVSNLSPVKKEYTVKGGEAKEDIDAIYKNVHAEAANAVYNPDTKEVTPSVTGYDFDVAAAKQKYDAAQMGEEVVIDLKVTQPFVSGQSTEEVLFKDVLYTIDTPIQDGYPSKIHNISLACQAVNGKIVEPGALLSFNDSTGPITYAAGYQEGTAYVGGEVVPSVGGGVCQVSSTLYCCALYTDMEIVERYNHMFTVGYLPLGIDATIYWDSLDFVFRNNKEFPIKVEAYVVDDAYVRMTFYGTKTDDTYVEVYSETISTTPYGRVEKEDPSIPAGTSKVESYGFVGYVVDTYKTIYNGDGTVIETEYVGRSEYSSKDTVVLVPVKQSTTAATPEPDPATEQEEPAPEEKPDAGETPSSGGEAGEGNSESV